MTHSPGTSPSTTLYWTLACSAIVRGCCACRWAPVGRASAHSHSHHRSGAGLDWRAAPPDSWRGRTYRPHLHLHVPICKGWAASPLSTCCEHQHTFTHLDWFIMKAWGPVHCSKAFVLAACAVEPCAAHAAVCGLQASCCASEGTQDVKG